MTGRIMNSLKFHKWAVQVSRPGGIAWTTVVSNKINRFPKVYYFRAAQL